MIARRLLGLTPLLAASLLCVGPAAASDSIPVWQAPVKSARSISVIASPQASGFAWLAAAGCNKYNDQLRFQALGVAGMGSVVALTPCNGPSYTQFSAPSVTFNQVTHKLYVVWAQTPPNSKISYLYARASADGGRSFGKRMTLRKLTGESYPPVITAAAYAARIWVMWASTIGHGKRNPLRLAAFDPRSGEALPPVQGLGGFYTVPDNASMRIFPSKDGVAVYWLDYSGTNTTWRSADTERIPASTAFHVRFVYRGLVGLSGHDRLFVGEDGKIYRLTENRDDSDPRAEQAVYQLSRWAFASHSFVPAYAEAEVARVGADQLVTSTTVAAQVDAQHALTIVYQAYDPSRKVCMFGVSVRFNECQSAIAPVAPAGSLTALRIAPDGSQHPASFNVPIAPVAPSGAEVLAFPSYFISPENLITSRFGSPRLFTAFAYGQTTSASPKDTSVEISQTAAHQGFLWAPLPATP